MEVGFWEAQFADIEVEHIDCANVLLSKTLSCGQT